MSKNITLFGVDYTDVFSIALPKTGGGIATFKDFQEATGTFIGNGTRSVVVPCDFEPDLVYWTCDPGTTASSGTVSCIIMRDSIAANQYRNNSTTNSNNIQISVTSMNTGGSSYNFRATYASGNVTLYCFSSAARSLFTSDRTYTYRFIKWTK